MMSSSMRGPRFGFPGAALLVLGAVACSDKGQVGPGSGATTHGTTSTTATGGSGGGAGPYVGGSLPADSHIVLLHHSTGGVVWDGGVEASLGAANAANGTSYVIGAPDYPSSNYPLGWQNYPYDYWHLWVEGGGQATAEGETPLASLAADNRVVVFKHCFPVSGIEPDSGAPDIGSQTKSIENYELQYAALADRLHQFPATRFVVWTGAALLLSESSVEQGQRSRAFFTWVKEQWDVPGDNIFVWDFFELETGGGDFLLPANAAGDSHPSAAFAQQVAPLFVNRLLAVLAGQGDGGSLTGQ